MIHPIPRKKNRTAIVWAVFVTAMTAVAGLLLLTETPGTRGIEAAAMHNTLRGARGTSENLSSSKNGASWAPLPSATELDLKRWRMIVVHHSGSMAGTTAEMDASARRSGLDGLGYHFVIGNGSGLSDGVVDAGYRWNNQMAGAHVARPWQATDEESRLIDDVNTHAIGICLIGNGDRQPFTEGQLRSLIDLVQSLQRELDIPRSRVVLHADLAEVSSPGRFFPVGRFETHINP